MDAKTRSLLILIGKLDGLIPRIMLEYGRCHLLLCNFVTLLFVYCDLNSLYFTDIKFQIFPKGDLVLTLKSFMMNHLSF